MSEKEDIKTLIERAKTFIKSSKLLCTAGDFNSTASRMYYAMFYAVEAILFTKNITTKSHGSIIALFGEYFIKTKVFPKEMGRYLNKAYEKRQIGDYGLRINIEKEVAEELLRNGEKFIEEIIEYLKNNDFL